MVSINTEIKPISGDYIYKSEWIFISIMLEANPELSLSAEVNGKTEIWSSITGLHFQSWFRLLPHVCGAELQMAIRLPSYPLISYPKIGHPSRCMTLSLPYQTSTVCSHCDSFPFQLADSNESPSLVRVQYRGDSCDLVLMDQSLTAALRRAEAQLSVVS